MGSGLRISLQGQGGSGISSGKVEPDWASTHLISLLMASSCS